jgi:carboxyl-terminal processing protease
VQNIEELEGGKSAVRLTIATYWRPSGKDIHKRRNATDADDWGVRPDAGLEVKLNREQYQARALARRNRDVTPLAELLKASAEHETRSSEPNPAAPPVPIPDPSEDGPAAGASTDAQLDKAIEYLLDRLKSRPANPRAA